MYRFLPLLALITQSCLAQNQCQHSVEGLWQSDHALTMTHLRDQTKLSTKQMQFLDQSLGRMTIQFHEGSGHSDWPARRVLLDEKIHDLAHSSLDFEYQLLGCDPDSVALMTSAEGTEAEIIIYHFIDRNIMWLYTDSSNFGLVSLHMREYFRRIENETEANLPAHHQDTSHQSQHSQKQ